MVGEVALETVGEYIKLSSLEEELETCEIESEDVPLEYCRA